MISGTRKVYLSGFSAGLLLFATVIRSAILVDRSFLPRFLLLSVLLLVAWLSIFKKENVFQLHLFVVGLFLFYLWNLLSCLWAVAPSEALMQSQLVFVCLVLFVIISALTRENPSFENIFIKTLLFILLLSFALAFYKMSTLEYFDPYKIISVSANNNLYAGFLILSLPFVFAGYALNKGFWRYLAVFVCILTAFFIIIIQSRAAYLGLFAGSAVAVAGLTWKYPRVFSKKNIMVGFIALIFLIGGVSLFYSSLDNVRKHYFLSKIPVWNYFGSYETPGVDEMMRRRGAGKAGNNSMAEFDYAEAYYENANLRAIFWKKSAHLIAAHPVAGVGAGNWRLAIPACKEPANPLHTIKNYTYSQPHNEWISILSELGLTGFFLAMCVYFIPLVVVGKRIAHGVPKPPVEALFYLSFLTGFYLFASFDFPLKRIEHNVLFFTACAFLFQKVPLKQLNFPFFNRNYPRFLSGIRGAVRGAILLFLLLTIVVATTRIRGEYFTLKMFRYEGKNADGVIQNCHEAESYFYRITPNTLPLAWFEGVAWFRKGDSQNAMQCFQHALKATPYEVRVLNDYAAALFKLSRAEEAKSVLRKAIAIDPFFDDARFNLGAIFYLTGQTDSAISCIKQCRDSGKKDDFMRELEAPHLYPQ